MNSAINTKYSSVSFNLLSNVWQAADDFSTQWTFYFAGLRLNNIVKYMENMYLIYRVHVRVHLLFVSLTT